MPCNVASMGLHITYIQPQLRNDLSQTQPWAIRGISFLITVLQAEPLLSTSLLCLLWPGLHVEQKRPFFNRSALRGSNTTAAPLGDCFPFFSLFLKKSTPCLEALAERKMSAALTLLTAGTVTLKSAPQIRGTSIFKQGSSTNSFWRVLR